MEEGDHASQGQSQEEKYVDMLEQARAFKDAGNQHYQDKDFRSAMRCYHKCLLHARVVQQIPDGDGTLGMLQSLTKSSEDCSEHIQTEAEISNLHAMRTEADDIVLKCYNNLAACILNGPDRDKETYFRAADYCQKVLAKDPENEKALFRKGMSYLKAGAHEKAIEAFDKCSNQPESRRQRGLCLDAIQADRRRRDEEIRRNFIRAEQRRQGIAQHHGNNVPNGAPDMPNGEIH